MELVKGIPITQYCDGQGLTVRQRLALMASVCQAVQHAHQKGIIHRDLKPSNVLVAAYDGKPVPKVIDFGIAKAVGQRLTERTLFTGFGSILGTLEYMSPEQAEFNALDIDTRSDVYSLGVLLYELLTGTTPLTRQRLEKAALLDILRAIREEEPPAPSTRLSQARLPEKSGRWRFFAQRTAPLAAPLHELDWIVMKALEKDRGRRYETADALTRDLERYLRDEAVEACPPSTAYRLKKFVTRHRALVLASALVVLTLLGGVVGTTWGLLRALNAEKVAEDEKNKAVAAAADTRAFSDFLLFEVLAAARLKGEIQGVPPSATIADSVAEAEKNIAERFKDRPTAEADVRHALGVTWRNMKKTDAAEKQFRLALELRRRHLGTDAPQTLSSQRCLGATLDEAGRTAEGLPLLEDALQQLRRARGSDDRETLLALDNLGAAYARTNRLEDALALQTEALKRGSKIDADQSADMLRRRANLAVTYTKLNRPADALPWFEKVVKGMKAVNSQHPETLDYMNRLAEACAQLKAYEQAIPVFEELLALQKKGSGMNYFASLQTMQSLAITYAEAGRMDDLRRLMKDYLEGSPSAMPAGPTGLPAGRPAVQMPSGGDALLAQVGFVLLGKEQYKAAEEYLHQCLKMRLLRQPDGWSTASARSLLGAALLGQKKYEQAAPLLLQGYEGLRTPTGQVPPAVHQERLVEALERLVRLYDAWGKPDEANKWRKTLDEAKAQSGRSLRR
jgi:tetratricopeptide (TPR) repeat protein